MSDILLSIIREVINVIKFGVRFVLSTSHIMIHS